MRCLAGSTSWESKKSLIPSTQHWTFDLPQKNQLLWSESVSSKSFGQIALVPMLIFFDREQLRSYLSQTEREWKKLSLQFKLSNGNDIFLTLFGIRTQDAFCSLRYALSNGQKPFEFVIFYTGRQSHLCLSACAFFLKAQQNCPLAKGQRPQEAQTRQQTLGPQHSTTTLSFK